MQTLESLLGEISKIEEEIATINEEAMDKKAKKKKEKEGDLKVGKPNDDLSGSRSRRDTDPNVSDAPFRRKTGTDPLEMQAPRK